MDDFATVIWVVIIAGAMIFNVVSQSRKARGKGARTPGHEEAWPSQAHPESEPEHTTPKAAGRGHLRHQTVNRLMDDSGNDEIAAHSLTNNAPDAATTSQTEEFNLRQAIIYSEILKPKFEE